MRIDYNNYLITIAMFVIVIVCNSSLFNDAFFSNSDYIASISNQS
jgi:hypothetical protein